jgi:hypothetical protein
MDIPRLKVPHDTPPLRGFQPLVSRVLDFRLSRSSNLLLRKPGFRPLLGPISPGWTPGLDSFLANSLSNLHRLYLKCGWLRRDRTG